MTEVAILFDVDRFLSATGEKAAGAIIVFFFRALSRFVMVAVLAGL